MAYVLQQLLANSALLYGDKTAVWARERALTYRELSEQSNQFAHLLQHHGVKNGDRIGLFLPKCIESVVCLFGILKAGGVYVPLDPQAPADRIAYILRNCGIRALITDSGRRQALQAAGSPLVEFCVLFGDSPRDGSGSSAISWGDLRDFPTDSTPTISVTETDVAYILYTSGSTGRPKGVTISHRNALTFVDWCAATFKIRPEDRLSNHAPLHFDLSVFDIYNAIEAGATVYLVTEDIALFPSVLGNFLETHEITIWYSVPSALILLLLHARLERGRVPRLRSILFAGEVFPMKYLRQLAELLPGVEFYNLYGPTETNVCTYYKVELARLNTMESLPIGIACENTGVFVVDDGERMVLKPGETGELYVRGPSVACGYWADPDKTRQTFVPNQFQPHVEEKVYRTGDLVSIGEDGNYYFLGRRDSMIKSGGYRIELGEIESALLSHPGVREAAAVAIPDEIIGNRIKAIVAAQECHVLRPVDLQQHCATLIPKYMIPEVIEFRDALPKTSTGKIDRMRLA
jgi:amino acid adenylation domain-containing protein